MLCFSVRVYLFDRRRSVRDWYLISKHKKEVARGSYSTLHRSYVSSTVGANWLLATEGKDMIL